MTDLPDFSAWTRSASRSAAKWADMVGLETAKRSESSPADIGRLRSSCSTRRRVGSESALNTPGMHRHLANYLNDVKWLCQRSDLRARPHQVDNFVKPSTLHCSEPTPLWP